MLWNKRLDHPEDGVALKGILDQVSVTRLKDMKWKNRSRQQQHARQWKNRKDFRQR